MELKLLNFDEDTKEAIYALRMKLELVEGKRTRAIKSIEDLVTLIKYCEKCLSRDVTESLSHFVSKLDKNQRLFFKTLGVDFESYDLNNEAQFINYGGANALPTNTENTSTDPNAGKKRIVYRGQERWV